MRFEIQLQIKGVRCIKGLFTTLLKVLFSSKEKANIFMVYFMEPRQLRFLVDSENCMAILAIDPRISITDKSTRKEGSELLVVQFKEGESLLRSLCQLVEKQGVGDVTFSLSKDKARQNQEPFRSLDLNFSSIKFRNEVFKPQYDQPAIIQHQWLNGCPSPQLRKVEFDMDTEHLLNILRFLVRSKQTSSKQKFARIIFSFTSRRVSTKLQTIKHNSFGEITYHQFRASKYEGDYTYCIKTEYAAKVYQLFLGKSSGSKMYIDTQNRIIFQYYQEGVFECQVMVKEWMMFESFNRTEHRSHETKLEL